LQREGLLAGFSCRFRREKDIAGLCRNVNIKLTRVGC
jgi:hypothetical protein